MELKGWGTSFVEATQLIALLKGWMLFTVGDSRHS